MTQDNRDVQDVILAQSSLLLHRLKNAQRGNRGINLHRKEVELACAIIAVHVKHINTSAINHELTEQETND